MSQKALNNTTDQYISPLMGFSVGAVLAQSPVHAQTRKKKKESPPERTHTNPQCGIWLLFHGWERKKANGTMEAAHLRTNYDIVSSFARSPGVDLNYGFSSHRSVCPSSGFSFFSFFFSPRAQRWHGEPRRVTTNWWRADGSERRASARKADGRGMCAFVQTPEPHLSRARRGPDNQMQSEPLNFFFCTSCYMNLRQIPIEFLGLGGGGEKGEKWNLRAKEEKK